MPRSGAGERLDPARLQFVSQIAAPSPHRVEREVLSELVVVREDVHGEHLGACRGGKPCGPRERRRDPNEPSAPATTSLTNVPRSSVTAQGDAASTTASEWGDSPSCSPRTGAPKDRWGLTISSRIHLA